MQIEPLEHRIAPAATASFAAGILSLTGDNGNDLLTVTELATPGSYHVDGLEIGQETDFTGVISIEVNTRDGNDAFTFNGVATEGTVLAKDLKITGKGALQVTVNPNVNIRGIVSIDHGGGPNTPALTATIEGAGITLGQLVIRDGQGDSTLNFGDGARVIKGVLLEGGAGAGNDQAFFEGAIIGTTLTKTDAGGGSDQLSIQASRVGGALKFIAASDSANFFVQSVSSIKGPITATYTGDGTTTTTLAGLLGSINVTSAASNDTVSLGGANVVGNVTLKLGDGLNVVTHGSSEISGNVSITGGANSTTVSADFTRIYGGLTVAAPLSSSLSVTLNNSTVNGKLSFLGGGGNDGLSATLSTITGGITATLGIGTNFVQLDTVGSLAGVTINGSSGNDAVSASNLAIRGLFTAALGEGTNSFTARGSVGGFRITTGSGADAVELRELFVRGATTVVTGAGNDEIRISDAMFGGAFTCKAGDGDNSFNVEQVLASNNSFGTVFLGALSYVGGSGADTVILGLDANDQAITMATAKFSGGAGTNTLDNEFHVALGAVTLSGFTLV
jgi:hypothetical protein